MDRNKKIVKISIQGIIVNIVLVIFKSIVGLISNSIAIILDAVNNLSDAMSSIITIIGTKLSEKKPSKKHPFGYGRIEYFSSVIIAVIVLLTGLTSLRESVIKIIKPELAEYSIVTIIIIIVAVIVKFIFGRYVKNQGKKLNSGSLVASGTDAISDSVLSLATLLAIVANLIWQISLEGYLGAIISLVIIKSAVEILKDTINDMLGVRADSEITNKLKKQINSYQEVLGVYDLTIHNYGPNKIVATAHIQLDDNLTVRDVHRLTRRIEIDIYIKYGIILTLGIYASNDSLEYREIKKYISTLLKKYKNIIQMHGFYVDEEYKLISFDLIFSFDETNPEECINEITVELKNKYPIYNFSIILDADITD